MESDFDLCVFRSRHSIDNTAKERYFFTLAAFFGASKAGQLQDVQYLLENDFRAARSGATAFDVAKTLMLLQSTVDQECIDNFEFLHALVYLPHPDVKYVDLYLSSWMSSHIAVPTGEGTQFEMGDLLNESLNQFQKTLVCGLRDVIEQTPIAPVTDDVMGYRTPMDLLNKWDGWM